jgi:hypothetical protein
MIGGDAILKMYKISSLVWGNRRSANISAVALFCAAIAIPGARAWSAPTGAADRHREFRRQVISFAITSPTRTAQTDRDPDDDDKDVPPAQVDKYVNVYQSMQKNHGLTVEQAASKQGMTVAQFRSLEEKIERDDTLRERVRTALRKAANPNAKDTD